MSEADAKEVLGPPSAGSPDEPFSEDARVAYEAQLEAVTAHAFREEAENRRLRAAIRWALGEQPLADGRWFDEREFGHTGERRTPAYWWRSVLRLSSGIDAGTATPKEAPSASLSEARRWEPREDEFGKFDVPALTGKEGLGAAAQAEQPRVWTRQQCSPGDFGREVRFEIEHEDGTIIRYLGQEAADHCAALSVACAWAGTRLPWPKALPEVSKGEPRAAPSDSRAASAASPSVSAEERAALLNHNKRACYWEDLCWHCRKAVESIRSAESAAYALGLERAARLVESVDPDPTNPHFGRSVLARQIRAFGSVATAPTAPPSPSGALAGAEELTTKDTENTQRAATRDTSNPEER